MTDSNGIGAASPHRAMVVPDGRPFMFTQDESLLAAMHRHGIDWPSSCRNGTCRTCLGSVKQGDFFHTIDWPGLSAEEKQAGGVLPCVAKACSDLVIDRSAP